MLKPDMNVSSVAGDVSQLAVESSTVAFSLLATILLKLLPSTSSCGIAVLVLK